MLHELDDDEGLLAEDVAELALTDEFVHSVDVIEESTDGDEVVGEDTMLEERVEVDATEEIVELSKLEESEELMLAEDDTLLAELDNEELKVLEVEEELKLLDGDDRVAVADADEELDVLEESEMLENAEPDEELGVPEVIEELDMLDNSDELLEIDTLETAELDTLLLSVTLDEELGVAELGSELELATELEEEPVADEVIEMLLVLLLTLRVEDPLLAEPEEVVACVLLIDTDTPELKLDELAEIEGTEQDAKVVEVDVLVVVANRVVDVFYMSADFMITGLSTYSGKHLDSSRPQGATFASATIRITVTVERVCWHRCKDSRGDRRWD